MNRIDLHVRPQLPLFFGLVLVAGYLLITIVELARSSYDIAGAFLVVPVLAVLSVPMLGKAQRTEPDPWIRRLFPIGLITMISMGLLHFFVAFYLYGGAADSRFYSGQGAALAAQFWQALFVPHLDVPLIGNGFIIVFTGIIYTLIGPTLVGGYIVYSWLAFWGLYFCYRAFCIAIPGADHRRYAILIFFLPSIVFWSSGIGKESWMLLCSGFFLLGVARLLSVKERWASPLLAGLGGTALVRPHITALLVAGLLAGVLVRRTARPTLLSPIVRAASVVVVIVAGALVVKVAAIFLTGKLSIVSVTDALSQVQRNTTEIGQSNLVVHPVSSPLDLPGAAMTVLFRPFPWEAANLLNLASSVESALFMAFIALSWRRWIQIPRLLRQYPYIMAALVTTLLFVIAFSTLGNFGLLVRERAAILPLVFVPLCLARRVPATMSDAGSPTVGRIALR